MNVLWITNCLFAHHHQMMGKTENAQVGGSWLNAAYEASKGVKDLNLDIVTSTDIKEIKVSTVDNTRFILLPGGSAQKFDLDSKDNLSIIKELKKFVSPDIIIIWGTEARLPVAFLNIFKGIPTLVYMQGVIRSIYEHYYEGVPQKYRLATLRDYLNYITPTAQYNLFKNQQKYEVAILKQSDGIIVENDWCENICKCINPNLTVFRNKLPIIKSFYNHSWDIESIEPYSIFTNAGGYPIKGHHILLKALAYVKNKYPQVKCYIPGIPLSCMTGLKQSTGYVNFLNKLIIDNNLTDTVIYTGPLTTEQMAESISRCNVYVMPSVMENHSASLIEAMIVGAPCISSLVGGTAELIRHNENGVLYNSTDVENLAGYILKVFDDKTFAQNIAKNASQLKETRCTDFGREMIEIYNCAY